MSNPLDALAATLSGLSAELKGQLIERLSSESIVAVQAAAADAAKKTKLTRILAMRETRDPEFRLVEGALKRLNITVEEAVDLHTLDKLLAAAGNKASIEDRLFVKVGLRRLNLID